jgi:hypothetical protein
MGSVPEDGTADEKGSIDIVEAIKLSEAAAQAQAESGGENVDQNNGSRCEILRPLKSELHRRRSGCSTSCLPPSLSPAPSLPATCIHAGNSYDPRVTAT